jgi:hypothetical protein
VFLIHVIRVHPWLSFVYFMVSLCCLLLNSFLPKTPKKVVALQHKSDMFRAPVFQVTGRSGVGNNG